MLPSRLWCPEGWAAAVLNLLQFTGDSFSATVDVGDVYRNTTGIVALQTVLKKFRC